MLRIGVNGFGRIGRYVTRMALEAHDLEVVAVNDLADIHTLAHLLKYDSIHRGLKHNFVVKANSIHFENGKKIEFFSNHDPRQIPWSYTHVDYVIESTGQFLTKDLATKHLSGGVKKVILSAPTQSSDVPTVVLGVNEQILTGEERIISNASCTTNNAAPMIKVMKDLCSIEGCFISTIHSYTTDQRLHDTPHKDLRRARAAGQSIVPTSTGAAKAIVHIFPDLKDKLGGGSVRVPVADGSLTEITIVTNDSVTVDQINHAMIIASETSLKGILSYTEDPIVSVDILGNPTSCLFDAQLTSKVGNMVKIVGWYDNEAGYSNRLLDLVRYLDRKKSLKQ
jgi:glyceraldehyde 3-phosphate dehydrogenase